MKSKIIDKNSLANIDLTFLDIEPFSNREALNWLVNKASDSVSDKKLIYQFVILRVFGNGLNQKLQDLLKF